MPVLTTDWAKALEPNIREWLHEGFASHPLALAPVLNTSSDKGGIKRDHTSSGVSRISRSSESGTTHESDLTNGYETIYTPKIFKEKIKISEEMMDWNMYSQITDAVKSLGLATVETVNIFAHSMFITAFNTGYISYGDAKPLCSTSHPRHDGGTSVSNASSTGIVLNEPNLETGKIALQQQKSDAGRKMNLVGGKLMLMVPEALEKTAVIITGSQKRSGTGNNDLNFYLGMYTVYCNPWIGSDITDEDGNSGSATAWFLLAMGQHKAKFNWDMQPMYRNWQDEDTDDLFTKVKFRCDRGWSHYAGIWGSKGDAQAYAS